MSNIRNVDEFDCKVTDLSRELIIHPLHAQLKNASCRNLFMESHVFAVLDFMSLVKSLQLNFTSVRLNWTAVGNPRIRRYVNEVVLAEESDKDGQGGFASHFELYVDAMRHYGADTTRVMSYANALATGVAWRDALIVANVGEPIQCFVTHTMEVAESGEMHRIAAAFGFGREKILPSVFRQILSHLDSRDASVCPLQYYLSRHIELDEDEHFPVAKSILAAICGANEKLWVESLSTVRESIMVRKQLWDNIYQANLYGSSPEKITASDSARLK